MSGLYALPSSFVVYPWVEFLTCLIDVRFPLDFH